MVHPQQVQHRRPQVVDGRHLLDGVIAEVVGRTVNGAPPHSPTRQPDAEAKRVVVATVVPLREWGSPELPRPDHQGLVEQAPLGQVGQQARDRLIDLPGHLGVPRLQAPMLVPGVANLTQLGRPREARQLDKPHPPLDQPAGQQTLPAILGGFRHRGIEAVERPGRGGLAREVDQFGDRRLHAIRHLGIADRRLDLRSGGWSRMQSIEPFHKSQPTALGRVGLAGHNVGQGLGLGRVEQ